MTTLLNHGRQFQSRYTSISAGGPGERSFHPVLLTLLLPMPCSVRFSGLSILFSRWCDYLALHRLHLLLVFFSSASVPPLSPLMFLLFLSSILPFVSFPRDLRFRRFHVAHPAGVSNTSWDQERVWS